MYFGTKLGTKLKKRFVVNTFSSRTINKVLFLALSVLLVNSLRAQPKTSKVIDPADAKEHFSHGNFLFAIPAYKQLLKQEPNNPDYNYRLGISYLYTNINKSLSIPYLEIASKAPKPEKKVLYHLGLAYQYASRFDDAIKTYTTYKTLLKGAELEEVEHQIETCENGKEYIKHPISVTFQNLGREINSEYPDYYPFVPANESFVVFTSRRKDNIGGQVEVDGYYSSDIYISLPVNDVWTKPKNMTGTVNTLYDEQAVGLTPDGQTMLMYIDHIDSLGNIYSSMNKAGVFQRMKKLNSNVNSDFETAGSITPDGNIIFFTSKREGGLGETDVYMSRKLPNGQWARAQNLGNTINTKYKEDFPQIAPDGKTLYFSSQGHAGMGDFDLFQSTWNEEENTWTAPKNLGYPINSVGDDRCISFTENNRVAYISAAREGGFGDLDLYRIKYDDIEDRTTILQGYITAIDSAKNIATFVTIKDLKNKDAIELTYNPNTGKFIMALTPSKYQITIEADGYKTLTDAFFIFDIGIGQNESKKFFTLQK